MTIYKDWENVVACATLSFKVSSLEWSDFDKKNFKLFTICKLMVRMEYLFQTYSNYSTLFFLLSFLKENIFWESIDE